MNPVTVAAARRGLLAAGTLAALSALFTGPGLVNTTLVPVLSVALFFVGLRVHRPPRAWEWRIVGSGLGVHLASGLTEAVGVPEWLSYALVSLGYTLLALGITLTVRALETRHDRTGLIDATIVATGSMVLVGQLMLTRGGGLPGAVEVYTVVDATLLGLVTRLQLRRGRPSASLAYLCLSLSTMLLRDLAMIVSATSGSLVATAVANLSFCFVAAAVLHPSVRTVTAPADAPPVLQPLRVLTLGLFLVASNAVLGALAFDDYGVSNSAVLVGVVVGPTLLSVMLVLRLAWALRDHSRAREELAYRALHDSLTGLVNRAEITDTIDRTLRAEPDVQRVGVLFCDLDDFKAVNDTYGHKAGDELLQLIAQRLRSSVRAGDTVGRLGGDEFVVCCAGIGPDELESLADEVTAALSTPARINGHVVVPAASVGSASAVSGMNVDDLLHVADGAMYGDKNRRAVGPRPSLRQRREAGIAEAFRRGLSSEQVFPHYQPILSVADGEVMGAEALARWRDPIHGLRFPGKFVPHLSDAGTIDELGILVLDLALAAVPPGQLVSVNVDPSQLRPVFTDRVARLLDAHGVAPGQLMVEITETGLLDASFSVRSTLRSLRGLGVLVALDDFGTGASSLSHLQWIDVDWLKIDHSFVRGLATSLGDDGGVARCRAIIEGTVLMAHRLGISVIAEGVETTEQFASLAGLGCDAAQGFLLGEPDPEWPARGAWPAAGDLSRLAAG